MTSFHIQKIYQYFKWNIYIVSQINGFLIIGYYTYTKINNKIIF